MKGRVTKGRVTVAPVAAGRKVTAMLGQNGRMRTARMRTGCLGIGMMSGLKRLDIHRQLRRSRN
ncbi:hypothetical protein Pla100_33640 [Neorhodopirellula pilleata]|uniref:Uncharacterized protein n=1 Tax=Neorhodopirellula pilleata TaxID=2714738 RepID=A0A5C6A6W1_9BACT|nr:hypothetical protein Pla100_33640 [Neorhodopirellula pilleata]